MASAETRVKLGPEIVGREAIATAAGSGAGDLVALTNLRRPFSRTTSQRGFPILQKDGRKDRSLGGEFFPSRTVIVCQSQRRNRESEVFSLLKNRASHFDKKIYFF
jgi:hypothetical protein